MANENSHREVIQQDCPRPEAVPSPLLDEYLSLLPDAKTKMRKVDDGAKDYDWYILSNPDLKDLYWDVAIKKDRDPENVNDIAYINGDGYEQGRRISYFNLVNDGQPAGPFKQIDIKFNRHEANAYVASQIITDERIDARLPRVSAATFDPSGHLLTFQTGTTTKNLAKAKCRSESE